MLAFLKINSYTIVKMMVNQVGMTIFGLVLTMATVSDRTLLLLTSIFSVLFYMVLLYTMSWEAGISDNIKLEAKRIPFKPLKFLYLSICANLINLILGFLSVIGYLFIEKVGETWSSPVWAVNMYGVTNAIARFIQGMWIGLIQYFTPENTAPIPIALILITLPSMAVCAGGYYLGLRGKTIRNLFGIKTGNGTSGMVK